MDADTKSREFVEKVCAKTLDGSLQWEKTIAESAFQATIGHYVVRIWESEDSRKVLITLFNEAEERLGEYDAEMFESHGVAGAPDSMHRKMRQAYAEARSMALGVGKALNEVIDALDNLKDVPF